MSEQLKIRIEWHKDTLTMFKRLQAEVPWDDSMEHTMPADISVAELGEKISIIWEDLYEEHFRDQSQMQPDSIFSASNLEHELPSADLLRQHVTSGETVVAKAVFMTPAMIRGMNPDFWEMRRTTFRERLRFDLNDRVICNCGLRWLSGCVVGTGVGEYGEFLPYLVKTDPLPGLESNTISVPSDTDDVVTQEVCFDHTSELHLLQASTPIVPQSKRSALRFAVGDDVVCRLRNAADGLENWQPGHVSALWPPLLGPSEWDFAGVCGQYADAVPYKVSLDSGGCIYCQADNHTLIRRRGMEPQTRVKGISKRMEIRKLVGGGREQIDHMTGRKKNLADESDASDED